MAKLLYDFLTEEAPKRGMLIGRGILPVKSKLAISGNPKIGKSFIVLNTLVDLALGKPLFNARRISGEILFPVLRPCRVLYIENEIGTEKLQERLRNLIDARGLTPEDVARMQLFIKSRDSALRIDKRPGQILIESQFKECMENEGLDVVVFDPVSKFHLCDENDSQQMRFIANVWDAWIEQYGFSLIYVHHDARPQQGIARIGGQKMRGSTALHGDLDSYIGVERLSAPSAKEPVLKLDFDLRHDEPIEDVHVRRLRNGTIAYLGDTFKWRGGAGVEAVKDSSSTPTPVTARSSFKPPAGFDDDKDEGIIKPFDEDENKSKKERK